MPKTPDRFPGERREEEVILDDNPAPVGGGGSMSYTGGGFVFEDTVGTFDPRTGSGLSETQHRNLDQLVHDVAETAYLELTYDGNDNVTDAIWWTNSGKTVKIREYNITYDGNDDVTQLVAKQYNGAGTLVETFTLPVAYSGGDVANIDAVLS